MREIKFRFFDGVKMNHNIIGYDFNCGGPDKQVLAVWNDKEECIDYYRIDEDLVLMQYTGLKDKNGKEIYEGDIIKFYSNVEDCFINEKVEYHFGIIIAGDYILANIFNQCKVIGNIYENKELLV